MEAFALIAILIGALAATDTETQQTPREHPTPSVESSTPQVSCTRLFLSTRQAVYRDLTRPDEKNKDRLPPSTPQVGCDG